METTPHRGVAERVEEAVRQRGPSTGATRRSQHAGAGYVTSRCLIRKVRKQSEHQSKLLSRISIATCRCLFVAASYRLVAPHTHVPRSGWKDLRRRSEGHPKAIRSRRRRQRRSYLLFQRSAASLYRLPIGFRPASYRLIAPHTAGSKKLLEGSL